MSEQGTQARLDALMADMLRNDAGMRELLGVDSGQVWARTGSEQPAPVDAIAAIQEGQRRAVEMHEQQRKEAARGEIDRLVWHPRNGEG